MYAIEKLAALVHTVLRRRSHYYLTRENELVRADRADDINWHLRNEHNLRNVSGFDERHYRNLGFRIVTAQYLSGARPTGKFCEVVVSHTCSFTVRQVGKGAKGYWILEGTEFLDGAYRDPWEAFKAIREVGHG